jgi:5S rRNA maturation endonuclease (ribonuclease M5)
MNNLLTLENFRRYYIRELPTLDSSATQQDVCCQFHNDSTPSLSVKMEAGEWFCHACSFGGGMVHFEMRLLDVEDKRLAWQSIGMKLGFTLFGKKLGQPTSEHVWRDLDGEILFVLRRYADGSGRPYHLVAGKKKMKLGMGSARGKRSFYNLPEVLAANTVVLVEGETKADPLALLGLQDVNGKDVAVTTTGSANSWRSDFVELLKGKHVLLLPDADEAGDRYAEAVQASLDRAGIEHQTVYFAGFKDVRGFLEHSNAADLVAHIDSEWLQAPQLLYPQPIGSIRDI